MKLSTADLRIFDAIADERGITAAARRLGLSKSAVSRELAAIEERLATRLVHRTTRRLSLTEAGQMLAPYARRIVAEMAEAEAAIEATRGAPRGSLRVSAPFSVLRFVLAPRLAEFRRRFPELRLALDASMLQVDLVQEGVDVAIRIGPLPSSSLVARRIALVPLVLVATPAYLAARGMPETPAALAGHDILNLRGDAAPETWRLEAEAGGTAEVTVVPAMAVHDPGLMLELCRQDLGIGPMPLLYAAEELRRGHLVRVLPGWRRALMPIHALYVSRRTLAPKVRAFVDFVAAVMAEAGASAGCGPAAPAG